MRGLFRNSDDMWLAGVCGGIANHFRIDPSIIRVLMALFCMAGWGLLLYLVLWIVLPTKPLGAFTGKRFYRDMDNKTIAGVASGIARYFDWDVRVVRLIFITPLALSLVFSLSWPFLIPGAWLWNFVFQGSFVGTMVFSYILLWIILPPAHADGPELSKDSSPLPHVQQEPAQVRASIGEPLGVILRVFLYFLAGVLIFSLFVVLLASLFAGAFLWPLNNYIWTSDWQKYYALGTLFLFVGLPVVAIIIWLIRRVVGAKAGSRALRWTFSLLWLTGIVSAVMLLVSMANDFRYYDHSTPVTVAVTTQPKERLRVVVTEPSLYPSHAWWSDDEGFNWDFSDETLRLPFVRLRALPSSDAFYHIVILKYSAGKNKEDGSQRASSIRYKATYNDGILDLGSNFSVDAANKYRLQNIVVEISIPVGKRIQFDQSVAEKLNGIQVQLVNGQRWSRKDINVKYEGFSWKTDIDYVMTPEGTLKLAD